MCPGFHTNRTYDWSNKNHIYGMNAHDGVSTKPTRCLNCRGPCKSTNSSCLARPRRKNEAFFRPTRVQLRKFRAAEGRDFIIPVGNQAANQLESPTDNSVTGDTTPTLHRSKTHPPFETFSPISTWNSQPRVFTYVCKDKELRPFQTAVELSQDFL